MASSCVIINRPGKEGGIYVRKQIHLDEQAWAYIYYHVQPFPHGVCTRPFWSRALLLAKRGKGRTSWHPVRSLLFVLARLTIRLRLEVKQLGITSIEFHQFKV